jgi:hypothetical protein
VLDSSTASTAAKMVSVGKLNICLGWLLHDSKFSMFAVFCFVTAVAHCCRRLPCWAGQLPALQPQHH